MRWPFGNGARVAALEERLRIMGQCAGVINSMSTWVLEAHDSVSPHADGDLGAAAKLRSVGDYLKKIDVMAKFMLDHAAGTAPLQVMPPALQPKREG